jgi:hypothetical protein
MTTTVSDVDRMIDAGWKMSRARWLWAFNREAAKQNRRVLQTKSDDPAWVSKGDYYLIDTRTGRIVLTRVQFDVLFGSRRWSRR